MSRYHYVRRFHTSAVHTGYQPVRSLLLRPLNSHCDQVHHVMMQTEYPAKSQNPVHTGLQFYQPVRRRLRCVTQRARCMLPDAQRTLGYCASDMNLCPVARRAFTLSGTL